MNDDLRIRRLNRQSDKACMSIIYCRVGSLIRDQAEQIQDIGQRTKIITQLETIQRSLEFIYKNKEREVK